VVIGEKPLGLGEGRGCGDAHLRRGRVTNDLRADTQTTTTNLMIKRKKDERSSPKPGEGAETEKCSTPNATTNAAH